MSPFLPLSILAGIFGLIIVISLSVLDVGISIWTNHWQVAFYDALQKIDKTAILMNSFIFFGIFSAIGIGIFLIS